MNRKKISYLLIATLLMTALGGTRTGYASEIISETVQTIPVENYVLQGEEEAETEDGFNEEDSFSEEDSSPDDVVRTVVKTTPVEADEDKNGGDEENNDESTTREVVGRASVPDVDELEMHADDVINMVMPVIPEDTYDFVMDSQNLLSRFSIYKESYEQSSLYFTNSTGHMEHTAISDAAMAKNKSSVPVLLYVTLEVNNDYNWPVKYTDMDSVYSDEEKNLSFALIPVSVNAAGQQDEDADDGGQDDEYADAEHENDDLAETDDTDETDTEDGNDGLTMFRDHMISIDDTGKAEMILYLDGNPDNFDVIGDKYVARDDAVWSSLGFAVTGACNTNADWSEMDELVSGGQSIDIHISYRMEQLSEEQQEMIDNGTRPDPLTGVIEF